MYPVSFKDHPLASQIDEIRHHNFMKLALPHLISGIFSAVLIYALFRHMASSAESLLWLFANLTLALCTVVFYLIYHKKPQWFSTKNWGWVTFSVAVLWGLCWALPPFILLDTQQSLYVGLMVAFLVAMSAVPAPVMVHYPMAYIAFITLPLGSLWLKTLGSEIEGQAITQWLTPFLWVSLLIYGRDLHKTIVESIQLRLEQAQAHREAEQANVAKSKFIAAASHDIRQPLQAASLFLNALNNLPDEQSAKPLLNQLEKSLDGMSELIDSLLDISKLDAQAIETNPKHNAIATVFQRLQAEFAAVAKNKGLDLTLKIDDGVVYCDPLHLERILSNLLSNAIRYTNDGEVAVNTTVLSDTIRFSVTDTGIGISPEEQQDIFDEFYQVKIPSGNERKGLGLGLSIVRRLCELQHWPLELTSQVGFGSTFSFEVPKGSATQIQPAAQNDIQQLNQVSAIVVEDDKSIREGLLQLLKSWGVKVVAAADITQLESIIEHGAADDFNLIISDYRLSKSLRGTAVIDMVRSNQTNPVEAIIITGDTAPSDLQEMTQENITVLHKPVKPAQLRSVLQKKFFRTDIAGHLPVTDK